MATTNKDGKTYLEENETATGINFEADQQDAMKKTSGVQSLADQVERLEAMQQQLEIQEESIK